MNSNILHILLIVFISGVIGLNSTKLTDNDGDSGIIINGKNASDVPAVTTLAPSSSSLSPPPEPITTPPTTINPPTTTMPPPTTTTPVTTTSATTTTTKKPEPTTTTVAPPTPTTPTNNVTSTTTTVPPAPAHKGRHFDGPSFIGGIILASGLMAIGFVSWKFYKARTERNYHTL